MRERLAGGQAPTWWKVYQEFWKVPVVAQPGTGRDQDGEREWQEVNRRMTAGPKMGGRGAGSSRARRPSLPQP